MKLFHQQIVPGKAAYQYAGRLSGSGTLRYQQTGSLGLLLMINKLGGKI